MLARSFGKIWNRYRIGKPVEVSLHGPLVCDAVASLRVVQDFPGPGEDMGTIRSAARAGAPHFSLLRGCIGSITVVG